MQAHSRDTKDALYEGFALVAKGFASGRRAELIDVLQQGERPVEELAGEIGQTVANTSQHLRALTRAGLARSRRDGNRIIYRLANPQVAPLWRALRDYAVDQLAEVERLVTAYLGDRAGLQTISRDQLAERLRAEDLLVLDIRPEAEYRAGHIAGALPVPPDELRRRLAKLPRGAEIVAYCRGPYCVYADQAVREFQARGQAARRLDDGFPEWANAGMPTATGHPEENPTAQAM
jgi:Rhodanese-related sulfurtransferase